MRPFFTLTLLATSAVIATVALTGCGDDIECDGVVVNGTCKPSTTTADTGTTATTDNGTTGTDGTDETSTETDTTTTTTDTGPAEVDQGCPVPGTKPTGAACTDHCECRTGYCYDEAYLGSFRFCTRDCDGLSNPCGSEDRAAGETVQQYQCLNFSGTLANTHSLAHVNICHVRCTTVDDCKALGSAYDYCPSGFAMWDGKTVGAPSCQIQSSPTVANVTGSSLPSTTT